MSQTIDKKIVEMQFENAKFEANVGHTLSSLDKLKKSLSFEGLGKGFANINAEAKKVTLSSISDAADHVANRFSIMGVVAITTLVNIVNSAIQTGTRLAKALTIDPIKTGLDEYEIKLNSIQTILANTQKEGTTLDIVTDALNQLNDYSDKTIYNFQQMTRNVGTFTAAGVKLDVSVAAIKGIANLAAVSGSNAEQASTAMYQLSQALASGTVKLMDWNSVVNAGMGGQVFQEALKETARLHGVAIDQMIEEEGSFRETLQKGWLTSEVLTETLQKFTGDLNEDQLRTMGYTQDQIASIIKMGQTANDAATKVKTFSQLFDTLREAAQSGWAQTWEIIIGDFEEAKSFLTELNNWFGSILGASADARNKVLQGWKDLGGRTEMIKAFQNALNSIVAIVNPIKEAFREVFPPVTAQRLFEITKGVAELTERFKMALEKTDVVKRVFKGIFALFDIGRMAVVEIAKALFGLSGSVGSIGSNIGEFAAKIGDFVVDLRDGAKESNFFGKALETIKKIITPVAKGIASFFAAIIGGFSFLKKVNVADAFSSFEGLAQRISPINKISKLIGNLGIFIGTFVKKFGPPFIKFLGDSVDFLSNFVEKATEVIEKIDLKNLIAIASGGIFAAILLEIKKFVGKGGDILESIAGIFDGVKESLTVWQTSLKSDILLKIAAAIGIIALSLLALSTIDQEKLVGALAAITVSFGELVGALLILTKQTFEFGKLTVITLGLIGISTALLIFSGAAKQFQNIDMKALFSMALALGILGLAIKAMPTKVIEAGLELLVIAEALVILSKALNSLGGLSLEQIGNAVIAIAGSLLVLSVGLAAMSGSISGSLALGAAAVGLLLLAPALKSLGSMSWEAIGKGILVIAGVITVLGIAGAVMTPVVPTLVALAVAIGLIGVAALAAGVGMLAFSTGLAALAAIGTIGIGTLTLLITAMLTLLPLFATQLGNALTNFIVAISENTVEIQGAMLKMILSLLDAFSQAIPKLVDTISLFILQLIFALRKSFPSIIQAGYDLIATFLKAIRDNIDKIVPIAIDIVIKYINAVKQKLPALAQAGFELIIGFIDAMAQAAEKNIPTLMLSLNKLGVAIVKGVVKGILDSRSNVINEIKNLALNILQTFKETLGISSPAKEMYDASKFITLGISKSIKDNANIAYSQIKEFGKGIISNFSSAISGISDSINSEIDLAPTIRPVIDLTDIENGGSQIDNIFGGKKLNLAVSSIKASNISTGGQTASDSSSTDQGKQPPTISYTQINNSPKALSRIEIYRQTKNQLSIGKDLVGAQ